LPSDHLILGFDTSAAHCAAALLSGDRVIAQAFEPMARGQAEHLMPLLQDVLASGDATWEHLSALGVGVGPGNFTGIRIAVSAARGLALGLGIPAVGVTGCEARAWVAGPGAIVAIPAPRDQVYVCDPDDPDTTPRLVPLQKAHDLAIAQDRSLVHDIAVPAQAEAIARIAAQRWQGTTLPPAPLYARAADAAPARDTAPVMLDE
jgi:tRNA threonylcarbamoyl adenosine modification protein YeaZ